MKRLAFLCLALFAIVGIFIVTAPSLVSIEVVRRSITYEIAGWGGRALSFEGTPSVAFRPYLTVTFPNVRIVSARSGETLVAMDQLSAQIPLVPLVFGGRIEPSAFRFEHPRFRFAVDAAGQVDWTLPYGLDATTRVEKLEIDDGEIEYRDASGRVVSVQDINASLRWPDPAGPASLQARATWHGEAGEVSATIGSLRDFFEGRATALQLALTSTPLRAAYNGQIQQIEGLTVGGDLTVNAPSIHALSRMAGWELADRDAYGAVSLHSSLSLVRGMATLADAKLAIDGNDGEGALALDLAAATPSLQATLGFDDFEVSPFVELVSDTVGAARKAPEEPLDLSPIGLVDLDIRVSTERLLHRGQTIGRFAGSAALRDRRLDIAIGDLRLFDSRISANISAETQEGVPAATLRGRFEALKLDALPEDLAILPMTGTASGTLNLAAAGKTWNEIMEALSGTGSLQIENGAISGLNLAVLSRGWTDPAVARAAMKTGSTPFEKAVGDFTVENGVLTVQQANATGKGFEIDLSGSAPLQGPASLGGEIRFDAPTSAEAVAPIPYRIETEGGATSFEPELRPSQRSESGTGRRPIRRLADRVLHFFR